MRDDNDDLATRQMEPVDADQAGERDDDVFQGAADDLPSSGLLSFYDRLRVRVSDFLESRGGKLGATASEYLLLVPDVFMLLARLALDKRVPKEQRALIGGALAYFVMPIDFLPELMLGPAGYLDDLVLSAMVLSRAFGDQLEPYTAEHWSGSAGLRKLLTDISQTGESLVGKDIYGKLIRLLEKKGVTTDGDTDPA